MKIPGTDSEFRRIAEKLLKSGHAAYLVGGAVRDTFLKRPVTDFDIATDATPQRCMELYPYAIPTGIQHGTITVIPRSRAYKVEITTFRTEGAYSDSRHPDSVQFVSDIATDLSRRDFTINAMAIDLASEEFVDPFSGKADLSRRLIRAVGEPSERFREDALRALRAVRFSAQLEFAIDPPTLKAATEFAATLTKISVERVRDEFSKILLAGKPSTGLRLLVETGMIDAIVPELRACAGISQPIHGDKDVLTHLFDTVDAVITDGFSDEQTLILRLAALFHDIGKPGCMRINDGNLSFYGHEIESAKIAHRRLSQLKYPNALIQAVCHLVRHHMFNYDSSWSDSAVRRFIARVGVSAVSDLFGLRLADTIATTGQPYSWPLLDEFALRINAIIREKQALSLKDLAVSGDDLASIGVPRSKAMGALLAELLDAVLDDPSLNEREKLLSLAAAIYFKVKR